MFCYNCGNKLQEGALFCDNCGAKVKNDSGTSEDNINFNESQQHINLDINKVKSKIKSSANTIKSSSAFNRFISFFTKPLTTTLGVVKNSDVKEIFILGAIFLVISLITSLISMSELTGYYIDYVTALILSVVSMAINTFVTALFLKIGNGEDILRKGFGISIMTTGIYSVIGLIATIVFKVSSIACIVVSLIGILLYLNLYYISFVEHIKVSRDVKFILPVASIVVYFIVMIFILAEFVARTFLSSFYDILSLF